MIKQFLQGLLTWARKNWLVISLAVLAAYFLFGSVSGCVTEIKLGRQLRAKDRDIKILKAANEVISGENKELRESITAAEEEISGMRVELRGKERRIRELIGERNDWRDRVRDMPITVVVIETRLALQTEEVWERPDGVLFSLAAARKNLNVLGQFTLLKEERMTLQEAYDLSRAEVGKLRQIIVEERTINVNLTRQRANDQLIIANWSDKFDLSEGARKKARGKGRKEGTVIGATIVTILWIFLGK